MWFMNKIANPIVRLILRSRWHCWMSATVLLITYRGRKSRREYTLPVNYVRQGQTLYIIPGAAEKKTWWRNLRGGAAVQLVLEGKKVDGMARLLEGEADAAARLEAIWFYLERFPSLARTHGIRVREDGRFYPSDVRREATSQVMVRVDLT
jgi:deazaflavin-dependent oxidoreductase (nitroreductase family)